MELIDKDALVAEIKEWLTEIEKLSHSKEADDEYGKGFCDGRRGAYRKILSSINSLKVKEVDLEKEIYNFWDKYYKVVNGIDEIKLTAKYFFELGLKVAQKGEKV